MSGRHALPHPTVDGVLASAWGLGSTAILALLGVMAADGTADSKEARTAHAPASVPDVASEAATALQDTPLSSGVRVSLSPPGHQPLLRPAPLYAISRPHRPSVENSVSSSPQAKDFRDRDRRCAARPRGVRHIPSLPLEGGEMEAKSQVIAQAVGPAIEETDVVDLIDPAKVVKSEDVEQEECFTF